MNLFFHYPRQYWNTACLIVNSGANEGDSSDYSKLAVAIGSIKSNNIEVTLPDINKSDRYFTPSKNSNKILFGLKGIVGINDTDIEHIIKKRPFLSLEHFISKIDLEMGKMVSLIKSGCFDEIENIPRYDIMRKFISIKTDTKEKLTTINLNKLIENGRLPSELSFEEEVNRFRKFVFDKKYLHKTIGSKKWYIVEERIALPYFERHFMNEMEEDKDYKYLSNGSVIVSNTSFDKVYKSLISRLLEWLKTHDAVTTYNYILLNEQWNKYVKTNDTRTWEMETVSYYDKEHELHGVNKASYNISNYFDIPENPIILKEEIKRGRLVKTYQIHTLVGTVIDKNPIRHTVSLLLLDGGVATIKLTKGTFSFYNKQISKVNSDGKKTVVEKSWFGRGTLLMVKGFKNGGQFFAKSYNGHSILKIIGRREEDLLWLQTERANID